MSEDVASRSLPGWWSHSIGLRAAAGALTKRRPRAADGDSLLLAAKALLQAAARHLADLRGEALITAVGRIEQAYAQFPELEIEAPRSVLLRALREAAQAAGDDTALPLLMACVALDPTAAGAPVAALFERMVQAGSGDAIAGVIAILASRRALGYEEIAPVLDALFRRQQNSAALGVIVQMLGQAEADVDHPAIELGTALHTILRRDADVDPAVLAKMILAARKRVDAATRPALPPHREAPLLALAERVAAKLPELSGTPRQAAAEPPSRSQAPAAGEFAVAVPQTGGTAVEWLPVMQVGPAGERNQAGIRARTGEAGHLTYGPYAKLGAGDYRIRVGWSAGQPRRAALPDEAIATIEAVTRYGKTYLGQRTLRIEDYDQPEHDLPFRVAGTPSPTATVEVRIWTSGIVPLTLNSIAVELMGVSPPPRSRH